MPSLYNQQVAQNYNKAQTRSNFGGREVTFLVLYAYEDWYAGDPALSAIGNNYPGFDRDTGGYNRLWSEPGSRYEIAVNAIGSVAELFFLGEPRQAGSDGDHPAEESFVFAIATDTRNNWWYTENGGDEEVDEYHEAQSLYNALADALGHDAFGIYEMQANGDYFGAL